MSKRGVASFLAGLGTGYINAQRQTAEDARRDKKDKADEEERALRLQQINMNLAEQRQAADDRQTLRTAGAERAALPGTAVTTAAGDKNLYADPAQAQAAAADAAIEADMRGQDPGKVSAQAATGVVGANGTMAKGNTIETGPVDINAMNTPEAKSKRVIAALSGIDPLKAMDAQNTVTQRERETVKFTQEQKAYAKKLADEGVFDALKAMRMGNGAAVAEAFNRSGEHKIVGEVTMTPEQRNVKGLGDINTYTATFNVQMPDGSTKAVKYNSHDLGMGLMGYEKNLDVLLKGKESEDQASYRKQTLALQQSQDGRARDLHKMTMDDAKIPPAVKSKAALIADQVKAVSSALNKAMAEGQFDPKNPGTAKLIEQQAMLNIQYSRLIAPYMPGQSNAADPLGFGQPAAAQGAPAQSPAPAGGLVRAPAAAQGTTATPVDVLRGRIIGPLTSMADIQQSALAGNREAIAYLQSRAQGQADTAAAPRTAAEMLNR